MVPASWLGSFVCVFDFVREERADRGPAAPARAAGERSRGPWALPGPRGLSALSLQCECRRGLALPLADIKR